MRKNILKLVSPKIKKKTLLRNHKKTSERKNFLNQYYFEIHLVVINNYKISFRQHDRKNIPIVERNLDFWQRFLHILLSSPNR